MGAESSGDPLPSSGRRLGAGGCSEPSASRQCSRIPPVEGRRGAVSGLLPGRQDNVGGGAPEARTVRRPSLYRPTYIAGVAAGRPLCTNMEFRRSSPCREREPRESELQPTADIPEHVNHSFCTHISLIHTLSSFSSCHVTHIYVLFIHSLMLLLGSCDK